MLILFVAFPRPEELQGKVVLVSPRSFPAS